ncbi:MAG: transcriptional regulator [Rhodobacteraceae bacterium]|nr:transcriptional regulator [Paracoccaceae bacterium]MAY45072.1 transcriptional regulator [Paracoccaceae bacterium]
MKWNALRSESCPVARGLSVIGDRWTLLILRECFFGIRRFDDFQQRLGITRHVLAERLRHLEDTGVLRREVYQDRPLRHEYRLTEAGLALNAVLVTLIDWADRYAPDDTGSSVTLVASDTGAAVQPLLIDAATGQPITARTVRAVPREDPGGAD